jgi:predicted AlkP superfamily pyrophosphatase or phosphodiesterase
MGGGQRHVQKRRTAALVMDVHPPGLCRFACAGEISAGETQEPFAEIHGAAIRLDHVTGAQRSAKRVYRRPMSSAARAFVSLICGLAVTAVLASRPLPAAEPSRHLLIVVDGLRPDYVSAAVMPNLTALGKRGVVFNRHHSVYPTVTRVNASSISTGAYPETHGLLGNTVFFPRVSPARFLDTSDRENLLAIASAEGRLLTAPTLGETLQAAGRRLLVVSSGSSGSAFLNNHTVAGGAILHLDYALPAELGDAMKTLGPRPGADAPAGSLDAYAVDAFLKVGLPKIDPSVTVMWLSDLDSTAHDKGIGAPPTVAVLRQIDRQIGRIQDGLKTAGRLDQYDIWVTSDHGFSTYTGAPDIRSILEPFSAPLADGVPRVVAGGGAIYVRDGDAAAIERIVARLQETPGVGAIFTRSISTGSATGRIAGTLSFDAIRWAHDRSSQILYSPDWSDAPNAFGMRGTSASSGTAGHGSSSPWDIHNTLIAAGPDLKQGRTIDAPSANVDFAPTFLTLLGAPIPPSMQGRPLAEAFRGVTAAPSSAVEHTTVATADDRYRLTGTFSTVTAAGRRFRYFDRTDVVRK